MIDFFELMNLSEEELRQLLLWEETKMKDETKKLTDYEKIYRGCAIGIIENLTHDLEFLADDLEMCPGEASEEEITRIREMIDELIAIEKRLYKEIKPYMEDEKIDDHAQS